MKYFMFDLRFFKFYSSIYRLLVLNSGWKRVSLQITIFVYVCSTWSIVELKTRFETWITRNDVNGVSLFNLSYVITIMAYLCSQRTSNISINHFMFDWSIYRILVLNRGWKRVSCHVMIFQYVCSRWCIVELKTCFEALITRKDVCGVFD
jgi:hypothetical protein